MLEVYEHGILLDPLHVTDVEQRRKHDVALLWLDRISEALHPELAEFVEEILI